MNEIHHEAHEILMSSFFRIFQMFLRAYVLINDFLEDAALLMIRRKLNNYIKATFELIYISGESRYWLCGFY